MKRVRCLLILLVLLYITGCDGSPTTGRPATAMPSLTDGAGGDTSGGLTKPEKMCYGWNSELSVFGEEYDQYENGIIVENCDMDNVLIHRTNRIEVVNSKIRNGQVERKSKGVRFVNCSKE